MFSVEMNHLRLHRLTDSAVLGAKIILVVFVYEQLGLGKMWSDVH